MPGPTVRDVAKAAGVSLATVDRVLNERGGVRAATIHRVNEAVKALGYVRNITAANLARQRQYRYAFVLPESRNEFVSQLESAIHEASTSPIVDRTELTMISVPPDDPHALVAALRDLRDQCFDGVAIYAPETPHLRDEINHLKQQGLAVVALVSDLPNTERDFFVGFDNVVAGRTAAALMGSFLGRREGPVAVLTSSMQAVSNVQRRFGFDEVMAGKFPGVNTLPSLEGHDDPGTIADVLDNALARWPGMVGIYCAGEGNEALVDYLRRKQPGSDLTVIAHELTPTTRRALVDGAIDAVIRQDLGHAARSSLRVLRAITDGVEIVLAQERIRVEIILQENLP